MNLHAFRRPRAVAMICLAWLAWCNLGSDSAMQRWSSRQISRQNTLKLDGAIAQAAGQRVQIHFEQFDPAQPMALQSLMRLYFRSCDDLFPQPPRLGTGTSAINSPDDILRADVLPDDAQLRADGIQTVLTFTRSAQGVMPRVRKLD